VERTHALGIRAGPRLDKAKTCRWSPDPRVESCDRHHGGARKHLFSLVTGSIPAALRSVVVAA